MLQKEKFNSNNPENKMLFTDQQKWKWFDAISFAVFVQSMILVLILIINYENYDWTLLEINIFFAQLLVLGIIIAFLHYKLAPIVSQFTISRFSNSAFFQKRSYVYLFENQKQKRNISKATRNFLKNNQEYYGEQSFR